MPALSRIIMVLSAVYAAGQAEENTCGRDGCSVEFLQRDLRVDATKSKSQLQPQASGHVKDKEGFNCSSYPGLCAEPFNCHTNDAPRLFVNGALAKDGSPNFKSWCASPQYHEYITQCIVEKDLLKAAHTQYDNTKAGKHGADTFQLDGSYCFIEGHCLNQAVSKDTTLEEANAQCDARYGRTAWTTIGDPQSNETKAFASAQSRLSKLDNSNGFTGQTFTRGFLTLACAMGNYHCDVMYCKETYCKDQEMIQKYGHFLEELGWTRNAEKWFVGASE